MTQEEMNRKLLDAAAGGMAEEVRALIAAGGDVDARDDKGNTPLHNAAFRGRSWVVAALLALGADVDAANADGNTPLHFSTWDDGDERPSGPSALSRLLVAGAGVNAANVAGYTPLHFAAKGNNLAMVEALLDAGANPLLENADGEIPRELCQLIACIEPLMKAEIEWRDEKLPLRELRQRLRQLGALRPRNPGL